MPRGPAPEWKRRKVLAVPGHPEHLDAYIHAAVQAKPLGEDGSYGTLVINDIATMADETEIFRALRRAALHVGYSVSCKKEPDETDPKKWQIRFTVWDKKMARAYQVATYGPDRDQWRYNPRKKGNSE